MPRSELTARMAAGTRRHPRLVRRIDWLRRHRAWAAAVAVVAIGVILALDLLFPHHTLGGFYLLPLALLASSGRARTVAQAAVLCLGLAAVAIAAQHDLDLSHALVLAYGLIAGAGLVALAYLMNRLSLFSAYAMVRGQLAEASSDIAGMSRNRADLDELLQYVVERAGEQLGAVSGLLLQLDEELWRGRAGYGLGTDARNVELPFAVLPAAVEALERDRAVVVDDASRGASGGDDAVARLDLQRLLVAPMIAFGRVVGVLLFNRPSWEGGFGDEEVLFAESAAQYAAAALENVRLMRELEKRRRDLELVLSSSLDIAGSLDLRQVLEAAVTRLVDALQMDACDIFRLEPNGREIRPLVRFEDQGFVAAAQAGGVRELDTFTSSREVVRTREPMVIADAGDVRLSAKERELFVAQGHRTKVGLALLVRGRAIGIVELFDDQRARRLSPEQLRLARGICRFAALAIDNAQLYDAEREVADHLDTLTRKLTELQSISLDLNRLVAHADTGEVIERVVAAGSRLLGTRLAAVVERRRGRLQVVSHIGDADLPRFFERIEEAIAGLGEATHEAGYSRAAVLAAGLLVAPLGTARDAQLALVFAGPRDGGFDEEDRLLATTLAAAAGATLRNVLNFQREHEIAETFQDSLRIEPWPIAGLDVGVRYDPAGEAARIGGDFYDLVPLGPGRLMVAVGDVCGKGLSAAARTAVVRYMLRAYVAEAPPGEALSRLNAALVAQDDTQPFVTLVLAYVDVQRRTLEYAVAGHPRPIVLAGGELYPAPGAGDVPVGIVEEVTYVTNKIVLPPDAVVVVVTDGVTEARDDGELFGGRRLNELVCKQASLPAADLAAAVVAAVKDYAGGRLDDDALVVALRVP